MEAGEPRDLECPPGIRVPSSPLPVVYSMHMQLPLIDDSVAM